MEKFKLPNIEDEKSTLKTIRIKNSLLEEVEELSKENNISINRIIIECIIFSLANMSENDIKKIKQEN